MDQLYKILTCAYTRAPLPILEIKPFIPENGFVWTYKNFQMYKNALFNVIIICDNPTCSGTRNAVTSASDDRVERDNLTTVTLVVENRVYYWTENFYSSYENFIYNVQYPALANFVYTSWCERKHIKYLLNNNKPFTSHLVFSPNCLVSCGVGVKTSKEQLQLCIDLWDEQEDEKLTTWEMDDIKPWNVKDFKIYKKLFQHNQRQFNAARFAENNWDRMFYKIISIKPGFTEFYYKLYIIAVERGEEEMINQTRKRLDPVRLRAIDNLIR